MRAGKLVTGEELTIRDIRNHTTKFAFVAVDASENTKKKLEDKCSYYQVPLDQSFEHAELSQAIGRTRMIIGVNDQGFATKLKELITG